MTVEINVSGRLRCYHRRSCWDGNLVVGKGLDNDAFILVRELSPVSLGIQ